MCIRLIFHNLVCDVRPRISRGSKGGAAVNPYTAPQPCPNTCQGKEYIAPYFRCRFHQFCLTSAEYIRQGCNTRCEDDDITDYHVYTQRQEPALASKPQSESTRPFSNLPPSQNLPVEYNSDSDSESSDTDTPSPAILSPTHWEPLPTIDAYIPKLKIAVPTAPTFRDWRTALLHKGSQIHEILQLMSIVEDALAHELQHQSSGEHALCEQMARHWHRFRRYPAEPAPAPCLSGERSSKMWEKLTRLSDLLVLAEEEYRELETPEKGSGRGG